MKFQEEVRVISEKIENTKIFYEENLKFERDKTEEMNNIINNQNNKITHLEKQLDEEKNKLTNIINLDKSRNDEKSHVLIASIEKLEEKYESDMKEKELIILNINKRLEE